LVLADSLDEVGEEDTAINHESFNVCRTAAAEIRETKVERGSPNEVDDVVVFVLSGKLDPPERLDLGHGHEVLAKELSASLQISLVTDDTSMRAGVNQASQTRDVLNSLEDLE